MVTKAVTSTEHRGVRTSAKVVAGHIPQQRTFCDMSDVDGLNRSLPCHLGRKAGHCCAFRQAACIHMNPFLRVY